MDRGLSEVRPGSCLLSLCVAECGYIHQNQLPSLDKRLSLGLRCSTWLALEVQQEVSFRIWFIYEVGRITAWGFLQSSMSQSVRGGPSLLHHCADIGGGLLETRLSFCSKANVLMFTFLQQINTSSDICLRKNTIINTRTGDEQEEPLLTLPKVRSQGSHRTSAHCGSLENQDVPVLL